MATNNSSFAVDKTLQSAATSTGTGTAMAVGGLSGVMLQVEETFSATVTPQVTIDGSLWKGIQVVNITTGAVSSTITAAGMYWVPLAGADQLRANITSYTSGSVTATGKGVVTSSPSQLLAYQSSNALGTVGQGAQGSVSSPWFTRPTDGTNYMPMMDSSTRPGYVIPLGSTTNGLSKGKARNLDETVTAIKASAGTLYALTVVNAQSAKAFVQIFDAATGSVTLGTTSPDWEIEVPANDMRMLEIPAFGFPFGTAISIASTTAEKGSAGSSDGVMAFWAYQ